jgi:hypothetical protein
MRGSPIIAWIRLTFPEYCSPAGGSRSVRPDWPISRYRFSTCLGCHRVQAWTGETYTRVIVFSKTTVKLNKSLCEKAKVVADKAGYSSLDEFVEHVLERDLARLAEVESKDELMRKLKGLGYLE